MDKIFQILSKSDIPYTRLKFCNFCHSENHIDTQCQLKKESLNKKNESLNKKK